MPRYNASPTDVSASLNVFPKGTYEFVIGKPKAFERKAKAGHQSYGLRYPLTVANGAFAGKKTLYNIYLHSDGAQAMAKRYQMAAYGLKVNQANEEIYDNWASGQAWGYDTDTGDVDAGWLFFEGKSIVADVDTQMGKDAQDNDIEQQNWLGFSPVG